MGGLSSDDPSRDKAERLSERVYLVLRRARCSNRRSVEYLQSHSYITRMDAPITGAWHNTANLSAIPYKCGFCGNKVASGSGYFVHENVTIRICPMCARPTFFELTNRGSRRQVPGAPFGEAVPHVPADVGSLYDEARGCTAASAFTATVLACRKLLMHIAVSVGAKPNQHFIDYVEFLALNGYVPPNGKGWVDHIRTKGNEANHEIRLMTVGDATDLMNFVEMLLRFIYEFPNRVPPASSSKTTP